MIPKYQEWIRVNCTGVRLRGSCHYYVERMNKDFPELTICRGFYVYPSTRFCPHWWLKTETGEVVDPTAKQFEDERTGRYEEYEPEIHRFWPVGKCLYCGKYLFGPKDDSAMERIPFLRKTFRCSDDCETGLANIPAYVLEEMVQQHNKERRTCGENTGD